MESKKKMVRGVYAGTFDPITYGHLDIIKRSKEFCDELVVGIGINPNKKPLFTVEERIKQIDSVVTGNIDFLNSVCIKQDSFEGLLVQFARAKGATVLIRGIRSVSDFEYEITLANANRLLAPEIQTVFLPTSPELAVVSSSAVKEIGKYGGTLHHFVPPEIEKAVRIKFGHEPLPKEGFIKYGDPSNEKNCATR